MWTNAPTWLQAVARTDRPGSNLPLSSCLDHIGPHKSPAERPGSVGSGASGDMVTWCRNTTTSSTLRPRPTNCGRFSGSGPRTRNRRRDHRHSPPRRCGWGRVGPPLHLPGTRYLLSGGKGQSWEWLTEVTPTESWKYNAIGRPLWSTAEGRTRLEDLGDGNTRVHFSETYHAFNPIMRALFETRVHRFISKDNDQLIKDSLTNGVQRLRAARAKAEARATPLLHDI